MRDLILLVGCGSILGAAHLGGGWPALVLASVLLLALAAFVIVTGRARGRAQELWHAPFLALVVVLGVVSGDWGLNILVRVLLVVGIALALVFVERLVYRGVLAQYAAPPPIVKQSRRSRTR